MKDTQFKVLVFGIGKDIMGGSSIALDIDLPVSVGDFKQYLLDKYPAFTDVRSVAIAINNEYALDDDNISSDDEVAIIPPVSGG